MELDTKNQFGRSFQAEADLEEAIKDLENQCKISRNSGKFLEAQNIYDRIVELKRQFELAKQQSLSNRHQSEMNEFNQIYQDELNAHNACWEEKLSKFNQNFQNSEEQLVQKQALEYEAARKNLELTIPAIPRHSADLLTLQRKQESLLVHKKFKEAHEVQGQIAELEEKLRQAWETERFTLIQQGLTQVCRRHESELSLLRDKTAAGAEELRKLREAELDALLRKYQGVKREIKTGHNLERTRFDGRHTSGCGNTGFNMNQDSRTIRNLRDTRNGFGASGFGNFK